MRVYLVYLGTLALAIYGWKDWFASAAGLVLMMAVLDNPDMPREMLGIPGLNLWNFLLMAVLPAWLVGRRREGLAWDLPPLAAGLLAGYVLIIVTGFVRLALDPGPVVLAKADLVGEYLLNPLKFLVPAVLIFDGARSRSRALLTFACVLGVFVFLSVLVIKWVPPSAATSGGELGSRALRRLDFEIGFFRTGLSVMLAGGAWSLLAARALAKSRRVSWTLAGLAGLVSVAMALTAGRGGYLAWVCVGLVMSVLRWRWMLVAAPVAVVALVAVAPGVSQRALEGVSGPEQDETGQVDTAVLSAGRLGVWPYMIAKVGESPVVGFGRLGYRTSGLHADIKAEVDPTFPHPHNAYIEWLLDNGWVGMAVMLALYGAVLKVSLSLFMDTRHPLFVACGGMAFALVFAQLVGGWTGRYWYPNEETVGMWAAVGLALRVWVERSRAPAGRIGRTRL
jgi:O-antigen ligase